jgi:hypothetical protein
MRDRGKEEERTDEQIGQENERMITALTSSPKR